MGRKAKRAKISARIARLTGETSTTPEPTLVENSQKIEELKTTQPEVVVEVPTTIEEPAFMTEAPKIAVEETVAATKVEIKKTTTKKRTPRKKTTARARKTNLKSKNKSISSEK